MAKKKPSIPQYGTVTRSGIQYYRTRIMDADGKQVALYATTREELYEKELEARRQVEDIIFRRQNPTVAEYCEKWLYMKSATISAATLRGYTYTMNTYIVKPLGDMYMSDVTADDIRLALIPVSKMSEGLYNKVNMLFKCIFYSAERSQLLDYNPSVGISAKGGKTTKKKDALTDEQVKDFLRESSNDDLEIILKVILFTGLRESEALGLTWDNIDFKAGTLKVCKQLQKRRLADGGATLAPTKNGKSRTLKPAPFVMGLLDRQYREQAAQRLRSGEIWQGWQTAEERKTALVFTTPDGKSISQTSLRYHFKKVVEAIGVPSCRVHDLRHTFAVLSLQNGDDIKTVQGNLGHATAAFTLDVYGHVSEKMKEDSAARMEAYIKSL